MVNVTCCDSACPLTSVRATGFRESRRLHLPRRLSGLASVQKGTRGLSPDRVPGRTSRLRADESEAANRRRESEARIKGIKGRDCFWKIIPRRSSLIVPYGLSGASCSQFLGRALQLPDWLPDWLGGSATAKSKERHGFSSSGPDFNRISTQARRPIDG